MQKNTPLLLCQSLPCTPEMPCRHEIATQMSVPGQMNVTVEEGRISQLILDRAAALWKEAPPTPSGQRRPALFTPPRGATALTQCRHIAHVVDWVPPENFLAPTCCLATTVASPEPTFSLCPLPSYCAPSESPAAATTLVSRWTNLAGDADALQRAKMLEHLYSRCARCYSSCHVR